MEQRNVDSAEIEKFSNLAHKWWDLDGELQTLHRINPLRIKYIQEHVSVSGQRVLDIGCGGGILTESLAMQGSIVTGLDVSQRTIGVARQHALDNNLEIEYVSSTVEQFAMTNYQTFDIVTCMELLEHVPDPESVITACQKLLKPGGSVFFSTINRNVKSWLQAIVGAEYILHMVPRGTHQYTNLIRPSELFQWCRKAGIQVKDLTGLHYNPLKGTFQLGPSVNVNYFAYCVRP